jgi:Protein of unknown function (DUF559)
MAELDEPGRTSVVGEWFDAGPWLTCATCGPSPSGQEHSSVSSPLINYGTWASVVRPCGHLWLVEHWSGLGNGCTALLEASPRTVSSSSWRRSREVKAPLSRTWRRARCGGSMASGATTSRSAWLARDGRARRQRPCTASAISSRSTWVRRHGRPAVSKILDVVPERPRRVVEETWLEAKIFRLIAEAGLPPPRPQARLRHSGGKARVDLAYDEARLLVEVDGHGTHSTRQERRSDAERDVRLTIQRWRVARFTREDVVDRPDYVVGALRRLLAIR